MQEAQITRLNEEMLRLKELLVESRGKEREQQSLVADLRISMHDLQEKVSILNLNTICCLTISCKQHVTDSSGRTTS